MTLQSRLAGQRASDLADPEVVEAVGALAARIAGAGVPDHALPVGAPFPDFLLPDAAGALVDRAALLAHGPFVLSFVRGDWCPYCALTVGALAEAAPALAARGTGLAVVTPETGGRAAALPAAPGLRVLVDVDGGLAAACGVLIRIPPAYAAMLAAEGVDLAERQGNAAQTLPVPATFVVGRDGRVRWRHLDPDVTRRAGPEEILAALP